MRCGVVARQVWLLSTVGWLVVLPGCPLLLNGVGGDVNGDAVGEIAAGDALPSFPAMPSLAEEAVAVGQTLTSLQAALMAGDVAAATAEFAPEVRDEMSAWLAAHPDILAAMAAPLAAGTLTSLSEEFGWVADGPRYRSGEVTLNVDGTTMYIQVVKVDGRWMVATF